MIIKWIFRSIIIFFFFIIVLGIYLAYLQPKFHFPRPTGSYSIGTKDYYWVDHERKELFNNDSNHPDRELMVKVWYPSDEPLEEVPTTKYVPYCIDYFRNKYPLRWLLTMSRPAYSYGKLGLPLSSYKDVLPVIIYSPGFRGFREVNTVQCEELASQGYVVFGISHPYDNCVVKYPDGRIIDGLDSTSKRIKSKSFRNYVEKEWSVIDDSASTWLADVNFVLRKIEDINNDKQSFLFAKLEKNNIGMFGHSMGGSTAMQASSDDRIRAVVNLDGGIFGHDIQLNNMKKPCMVMFSGNTVELYEQRVKENPKKYYKSPKWYIPVIENIGELSNSDFYIYVVKDAGHMDFCDAALVKSMSPVVSSLTKIKTSIIMGSINTTKMEEILNIYIVNFFDKYLKHLDVRLFDSEKQPYSDVSVRFMASPMGRIQEP